MTVNRTQVELLRKLLRHGATGRLGRIVDRFRPAEIAEFFAYLTANEQHKLVDVLVERGVASETLAEVPEHVLVEMLDDLSDERVGSLVQRMAPDDAVSTIGMLSEERIEDVLDEVAPRQRERIRHLRTYPEESAGQLMTSEMIRLEEGTTADEAIERIRSLQKTLEFIYYVYVVDTSGVFLGVVPLRALIASEPDTPIGELMVPDPIAVEADVDREEVAEITARYDLMAVPVVDEDFKLLGVVTVDDVLDVLKEEATEDMYLMQGLSEEDRVYAPVGQSVKKRFPWMVINLATAFLAAYVVGLFENAIAEVVVLATFLPVVAGMGGNGGTQTLTVVTRGLALGELEPERAWRAIAKQVGIAIVVGAGTGILTAAIAWVWKGMAFLGLVLFLAMIITMAVAGLTGAAIPLVLRAFGVDPAMGSGVLVSTFTDVTGFLTFLGLGTIFIEHLA